jgi:hypothetical protein
MSANPPISISELTLSIIRLSSGHGCSKILMTVWNHKNPFFAVRYLAEACRLDVRTLKNELAMLVSRGMADVTYSCTSDRPDIEMVAVDFKYADWKSLPDYERADQ